MGRGWPSRFAALLLMIVVSGASLSVPSDRTAQAAGPVVYFPLSQHYLSGAFKTYWDQNGGLAQFGYPVTEPFMAKSTTDGKVYVTQYFERAVFEFHPEYAGTRYSVLLTLLGRQITQGRGPEASFQKVAYFPDSQARRFFNLTGHSMGGVFKTYWEQNGGLSQFGYPISEEFQEVNPADGKTYTVQYYERNRFEFHPEFKGTRYEVLLGLLGRQQLVANEVRADVQASQPASQEAALGSPGADQPPLVQTGFDRPNFPLRGQHVGYGMNVWLFGQDKERILGLVSGAGFGWVRQQVGWDTIEPTPGQYNWPELDGIVGSAQRNGIHLIFSVVRSPQWAGLNHSSGLPADPATYGNFMRVLADRYKNRVEAYEVWNEENLTWATGGTRIEAGRYVETLKAGYLAVKASDPWAIVLYGGLSPTGINDPNYAVDDAAFLEQSYQYHNGEMRNYFDALGAHPGGAANSPDELWPTNPPADKNRPWSTHPSFYFRRFENLRAIMEKYGDTSKQLWLTEFGWTTKNAAPGYEYGALVSEQTQADYLVRAFGRGHQYPWMGVMTMWNLNFSTVVGPQDEKTPWSIIRQDWSLRPAYAALQAMRK